MNTEQQSQQKQSRSEFEREPVPKSALLGFKSFIGMYAGEHCAGTELMIGPLFVAAGVGVFDLIVGLLIGNALAVLSWMFLCAPIATRTRLTLYYQLEKICGRKLVTLYNLANGVMFCFLAGAMVTVSATAVGVWFNFEMPGLNDVYPNSLGWVVAVAVVGGLIAIVAAYGYKTVAKFANIAAPWMVLVFLAFGFVGLRQFINATGAEVKSLGDFWTLANTHIWKGGPPQEGQVKFTFWHVMFFSWLQHGQARRHERSVCIPVRPQELVCHRKQRGDVRGTLYGLDQRFNPLCLSAASESCRHGCITGSSGLPGRWAGRALMCDYCRLDHCQPDYLSGGPGLPGPVAKIISF